MDKPTVTILGVGYVGLTTAVLTAKAGMKTYVVDPNPKRLNSIAHGKSFFYEEGLDPLVADGIETGNIIPTTAYETSVSTSDIVISSVGTPDNPDGSLNLSYVFAAATEAAKYLRKDAVFVQKSTVPVGTGKRIKQLFSDAALPAAYVSNPEFLREGVALRDSLWFDRIVIGGEDQAAMERVMQMYRTIETARDDIATRAGLVAPKHLPAGQYMTVALESAELIKVVSNAFLALKISFANSTAMLADKVGADIHEVLTAVGADTRIGHAFLNAGRGYGGGCFPKDVDGLIAAGLNVGVNLEIMQAAQAVNDEMPGYIVEKLQHALDGSLQDKTVAVLGLSFKAGTSDTRHSPGIRIANMLAHAGAIVQTFDPKANEEASDSLEQRIRQKKSIPEALDDADAVIVSTEWPEFLNYDLGTYSKQLRGTIFVDAMNRFSIEDVTRAGLRYIGVGRSGSRTE